MSFRNDINMAEMIAQRVRELGGKCFYVGGFVRDLLLGKENKDVDIEVHGVTPAQLEGILDSVGERISIGESFGIYALKGYSLDIAMPRRESQIGLGHKDFEVIVDPFIGIDRAALRRDFTINAMMQDVLSGEISDFYSGKYDVDHKIIRHVNSSTFIEDPLRVLRAAQFAARFGFTVAEETVFLCKNMDLSHLAKERVEAEIKKALLKSKSPSTFFTVLREMEQLDVWFPELKDLIGVQQNPKHHAEGDVWTHTMMVLDQAVQYRENVQNPFAFMLSVLTHDMGKAVCTEMVNGEIHAYNHESLGLPLAETFITRLTSETDVLKYVLNLTEMHMKPNMLAADCASIKKTNKMFDKAIDPDALIAIAVCDGLGKIAPREYVSYDNFFESRLSIYREYMSRPYVMGRDLVEAGIAPSPRYTDYLNYAHKLRLAGITKESALKQTLSYALKMERNQHKE